MFRGVYEVLIGAQQNKLVPDAELRDERVDGAHLHARPAASVSQGCGIDMVLAVWLDQCERTQTLDDLPAGLRAREALQEFLQDQARGDDDIGTAQCILERLHMRFLDLDIASERQRPDACIDQQRHLRERSAL